MTQPIATLIAGIAIAAAILAGNRDTQSARYQAIPVSQSIIRLDTQSGTAVLCIMQPGQAGTLNITYRCP